ncbi:HAMP domain-containing histidine kinase [Aestuariirhabdus sp. Z084]|uniref:sensor histidine kinase n=1 Tax=Aestuariirhabdus haliotis TaxID=2918751 RepID=UPI00201B3CA7|nr:HAMP domain-containing sensor histidine kinase [Aestuariirhabdus haliotis]MCL6416569.1 HAMP domain-containing histidine kinase [Aestuariirhabdus haliotis]MCL6420564.1 HAMP domain-containing histidine kinase [Aestuariirhabdus haliotis]
MLKRFSTFYSKLSLALLVSFLLLVVLLMALAQQLTRTYQDEVEQRLHRDLARHIVQDNPLIRGGEIDQQALKQSFHSMMILGPSFEFYLLGSAGEVITYSADKSRIKRQSVSLEPIKAFLGASRMLPIMGDDPRSLTRQKVFSVAEIRDGDHLMGYLYIIIGGEVYDDLTALLEQSHIVKLGVWGALAALAFGLLVSLFLFALLTRPLRRLSREMTQYRQRGFDQVLPSSETWSADSLDEIERLGATFNELVSVLEQQYLRVKGSDELRRELVSYISHDLRTPLAALLGYLETWQIRHGETEGAELVRVALENAQRVSALVEQLFELAHLDSADSRVHPEPVAIAELAQDLLQKLALAAEQQGISLSVEPRDPSLQLMADIEKLERVLTNLLDNAIRHCESGDRVWVEIEPVAGGMRVSVCDSGRGIAEEDLPHIFDPHYRGASAVTGRLGNSGLGLAISRRILQLHGSDIDVESVAGQGSRFYFVLPLPAYKQQK